MACAIDATAGGVAATSYATIAEADAYHDTHVDGATWAAATDDQKCRALVSATRHLDAYLTWLGWASTTTQALAWPRSGLYDPGTGAALSSTLIPERLKWATAEQARLLLAGDRAEESTTETQGITSVKAGSVEVAFNAAHSTKTRVVAFSAYQFVAPWSTQAQVGAGGAVPLARV